MIFFRVCSTKYASKSSGSEKAQRWNVDKQNVLYYAESVALACLETIVHMLGVIPSVPYSVSYFELNDVSIEEATRFELEQKDKDWRLDVHYRITQEIGSKWYTEKRTAVLKVPSAIIPLEHNFVVNPNHPDFQKTKMYEGPPFTFDTRLNLADYFERILKIQP